MTTLQRRIYGAIIRLHPASFRNEFGREMALDFEDAVRDCGFTPLLGDAMLSLARQWKVRALEGPEPDPIPQPATGHPFLAGQYLAVDQGTPVTAYDLARAALVSFLLLLTIGLAASVPNRRAIADVQSVRVSHDGGIDTGHNGPPPATNPARPEWPGADPDLAAPGPGVGPHSGKIYLGRGRAATPPGLGPRARGGPPARPITLVHALVQLTVISIIVWLTSMFLLRSSGVGRRAALAALGLLAIAASVAFGQAPIAIQSSVFDVVSIRPTAPSEMRERGAPTPGGYSATGVTFGSLIAQAYFRRGWAMNDSIIGKPAWVDKDQFDIHRVVSHDDLARWQSERTAVLQPMLQQMLQNMLVDRCKLVTHQVPAETNGYALVADKRGAKLTEAARDEPRPKSGVPLPGGGYVVPVRTLDLQTMSFYAVSMPAFVERLVAMSGAPVVDRTGLKGTYNFVLTGPPTDPHEPRPPDIADWNLSPLGLKVEHVRIPVEKLVIDHIERPSEN